MADLASKMELRELEDEKRRNLRADRERAILESGIDADLDLRRLNEEASDNISRNQAENEQRWREGLAIGENLNLEEGGGTGTSDGLKPLAAQISDKITTSSSQADKAAEKLVTKKPEDIDYISRMVKDKKALQSAGILPPDAAPKSLSDQFLEAMAFFAPTIGGALIGGAFEGAEGAVAGAKSGTELNQQWLKFQGDNAERNKVDPYKQFDALSKLQSEADDRQRAAEVQRRHDEQMSMQERRLGLQESEGTRREERLDQVKKQASQLTPTETKYVSTIDKGISEIDSILTEFNKPHIQKIPGFLSGSFAQLEQRYRNPKTPEEKEIAKFLSKVNFKRAQEIHKTYGSAFSKGEEKIASTWAPAADLPLNTLKARLETMREAGVREFDTYLENIEMGQPLKKETAAGMRKKYKKDKAIQSVEMVTVINPKGKTVNIKKSDLDKALKQGYKQ